MLHQCKKLQKRRWIIIVPIVLMTMILYVFDMNEIMKLKPDFIDPWSNYKDRGFVVHTIGCRIPDMDPFDEAVRVFYKKIPNFSCSTKPPLIESNQTSLWVVKKVVKSYTGDNSTQITCCYTPFWRAVGNVKKEDVDNAVSYMDKCFEFHNSIDVNYEFVKVTCRKGKSIIYSDYHAFIVPKKSSGSENPKEAKSQEGISILIIGADALSRLNFIRQMPQTRYYLKKLEAIEFLGYNKVHDNTFPNLVPLFSGNSVNEIQKTCWLNEKDHFDKCPWIWKKFKERGYLTAFGEDTCWTGIFNYLKNGFLEPPTDYYLRPYMKQNEDVIGHSHLLNSKLCCGARLTSQVLFDYALKLTVNLTKSNKKFWGIFWESSLTHDYLNIPSNTDIMFLNTLRGMNQSGAFEKTAVFVMSDHGIRWGQIRETFQGRLEERLPFLYIILPKWFREKYSVAMANLRRNTRALTTHYDTHETMNDLLNLSQLEDESIRGRTGERSKRAGISLFLPIQGNRTCSSASIPEEWCTCHESKNISVTDKGVVHAAKTLVDHINNLLIGHNECAELTLQTIHSARIDSTRDQIKNTTTHQISDYILVISTEPGGGKFEATVRSTTHSETSTVIGYVSRIDLYGSQSACIYDYRLRLYCYCKQ